ncbi:hypothetical protein PspCFBP13528_05925 [Pseudomonas sp. CFBP13528]|nr:hypothetical protein PspCFBP13528_05925 [Pseudomonas sp. CFBP13528]
MNLANLISHRLRQLIARIHNLRNSRFNSHH